MSRRVHLPGRGRRGPAEPRRLRAGFAAFQFATFPEFADLFQSYVDWHDDARRGLARHGRNILTVEIAESYAARALECAESTARELAAAQALDLGERRSTRRHRVGSGVRRRIGGATRHIRRAGRVALRTVSRAPTRPPLRWRSSPGGSRRRARRCSSPRARGSRSQSRSTGRDRSVSRQRAHGATVAGLKALLPAAESGEPRIGPARPSELAPLARIVARDRGTCHHAPAPRTYSRRSANTRACSAPGCATRLT